MTRNDNSYRSKGRALFLAAIMVLSVIAVPFAFAGGAAAFPTTVQEDYDTTASSGDRIFQGQEVVFNVTTADWNGSTDVDLFTTTRDDNQDRVLDQFDSVQDIEGYTPSNGNGTNYSVVIDTSDLDTGSYSLSDGSEGDLVEPTDVNFTIAEQAVNAEFKSDSAADSGADSEVDFEVSSSERNNYAINVSADGLDYEDLVTVFNQSSTGPEANAVLGNENQSVGNASQVTEAIRQGAPNNEYARLDSDEEVLTIFNGEQEDYTLNFTGIDAGEYDFEVSVIDTTASDSSIINVSDVGDVDAEFDGDITATQGDWAEITVNFENGAEEGRLAIGDDGDDGYQLNVTFDDVGDSGEVTVFFNTYTAGTFAEDVDSDAQDRLIKLSSDSEDDGASISSVSEEDNLPNEVLDTGSYEVAADAGSGNFVNIFDNANAISTLFIEQRADPSVNLWTASSDNAGDIENLDDVTTAVEEETLTETDTVASGDVLVVETAAAGISGIIGNNSAFDYENDDNVVTSAFVNSITPNDGTDFNTTSNFSLQLEQDNPTANSESKQLDLTSSNTLDAMTVLWDKESNTYYAIVDVDAADWNRGADTDSVSPADEDVFNAQINIKDNRTLQESLGDYSTNTAYENEAWLSSSQAVEYLDRDGDFNLNEVDDSDYITVEDGEEQEVSGTTNVAPGTEVTVRLRGTEGASFVKSQDVVVNPDGTFSGTFDFSDRNVDDEFEGTLRSGGELATEDGLVVEQVVDEPEDETAPEDETEDDMSEDGNTTDDVSDDGASDDSASDDSATDGGSSDDGESSEETPGFGAIVALVAVLGAALLASRRQN